MTTKKYRMVELRAELGIDQKVLADEGHVSVGLISKIERGHQVQESFALRVYYAINRLRVARGYTALEFDEIDWHLTET